MPPTGGRTTRVPWWTWLLLPFAMLVTLATIFCAFIFLLPLGLLVSWWGRKRFMKDLEKEGRLIRIDELRSRLLSGQGTLVLEMSGTKEPGEFGLFYPE
jgi:hypothetical protein